MTAEDAVRGMAAVFSGTGAGGGGGSGGSGSLTMGSGGSGGSALEYLRVVG